LRRFLPPPPNASPLGTAAGAAPNNAGPLEEACAPKANSAGPAALVLAAPKLMTPKPLPKLEALDAPNPKKPVPAGVVELVDPPNPKIDEPVELAEVVDEPKTKRFDPEEPAELAGAPKPKILDPEGLPELAGMVLPPKVKPPDEPVAGAKMLDVLAVLRATPPSVACPKRLAARSSLTAPPLEALDVLAPNAELKRLLPSVFAAMEPNRPPLAASAAISGAWNKPPVCPVPGVVLKRPAKSTGFAGWAPPAKMLPALPDPAKMPPVAAPRPIPRGGPALPTASAPSPSSSFTSLSSSAQASALAYNFEGFRS